MKRIHIHLPEPLIVQLRAISKRTGLTVSELIRRACDAFARDPKR